MTKGHLSLPVLDTGQLTVTSESVCAFSSKVYARQLTFWVYKKMEYEAIAVLFSKTNSRRLERKQTVSKLSQSDTSPCFQSEPTLRTLTVLMGSEGCAY